MIQALMFYLFTSLALLIPYLAVAKDSTADVSISLSFYSKNNETSMRVYNDPALPQKAINIGARTARLQFLDDTHVRFELHTPVHLQLFWDDDTQVDTVFKTVIVNAPAEDVTAVRALMHDKNYLSFESNVAEKMSHFIDLSNDGLYDELIRHYIHKAYPPSLQQFMGFALHLVVEEVGTVDGSHTRQISVVSRLITRLEWSQHSSASEPQFHPAHTIQSLHAVDDPVVVEYLRRLRLMNGREEELKYRGWLNPIKRPAAELAPTLDPIVYSDNVIPLPRGPSNSCQTVFR